MRLGMRKRWIGLCGACLVAASGFTGAASPTGAKALFDSGEGTSIGMSVGQRPQAPQAPAVVTEPARVAAAPTRERYIGISYQINLLTDNGQLIPVTKNRVFSSGERIKILARTNRPGYLTILNVGTSGRTHVLYNEYVNAHRETWLPNMRLVGEPGTEKILIMLSDAPNPIAGTGNQSAAVTPPVLQAPQVSAPLPTQTAGQYPPPPTDNSYPAPPPAPSAYPAVPPVVDSGQLPAPPPMYPSDPAVIASNTAAYSAPGAKDIMLDDMQSSFAVVSPKTRRPVRDGMKDIVLESTGGVNYGVVPAAAVADGGILTLEISLRHK